MQALINMSREIDGHRGECPADGYFEPESVYMFGGATVSGLTSRKGTQLVRA